MFLDPERLDDAPTAQLWIWLAIFPLLFVIWRASLQKMQAEVARKVNAHNVTASDYAVLVDNLSHTEGLQQKLIDFASHYGQVIAAFHLHSVGDALSTCTEVRPPAHLPMRNAERIAKELALFATARQQLDLVDCRPRVPSRMGAWCTWLAD